MRFSLINLGMIVKAIHGNYSGLDNSLVSVNKNIKILKILLADGFGELFGKNNFTGGLEESLR